MSSKIGLFPAATQVVCPKTARVFAMPSLCPKSVPGFHLEKTRQNLSGFVGFFRPFPEKNYVKVVEKEHLSGMAYLPKFGVHASAVIMQLIFWGAQPPRLLFGAPRAEHERVGRHRMVGPFQASVWAARARPTAPEAGALPFSDCMVPASACCRPGMRTIRAGHEN